MQTIREPFQFRSNEVYGAITDEVTGETMRWACDCYGSGGPGDHYTRTSASCCFTHGTDTSLVYLREGEDIFSEMFDEMPIVGELDTFLADVRRHIEESELDGNAHFLLNAHILSRMCAMQSAVMVRASCNEVAILQMNCLCSAALPCPLAFAMPPEYHPVAIAGAQAYGLLYKKEAHVPEPLTMTLAAAAPSASISIAEDTIDSCSVATVLKGVPANPNLQWYSLEKSVPRPFAIGKADYVFLALVHGGKVVPLILTHYWTGNADDPRKIMVGVQEFDPGEGWMMIHSPVTMCSVTKDLGFVAPQREAYLAVDVGRIFRVAEPPDIAACKLFRTFKSIPHPGVRCIYNAKQYRALMYPYCTGSVDKGALKRISQGGSASVIAEVELRYRLRWAYTAIVILSMILAGLLLYSLLDSYIDGLVVHENDDSYIGETDGFDGVTEEDPVTTGFATWGDSTHDGGSTEFLPTGGIQSTFSGDPADGGSTEFLPTGDVPSTSGSHPSATEFLISTN